MGVEFNYVCELGFIFCGVSNYFINELGVWWCELFFGGVYVVYVVVEFDECLLL